MTPRFLCLVLVCGLSAATPLAAQTVIQTPAQADSLRRVIATAKHDTTRINAMNELAYYFRDKKSQYDSAMTFAQESQKLAERAHFRKGVADALNHIGMVYYRRGKFSEALEISFSSLRIHQEIGNKSGMAGSMHAISNVYFSQGKYREVLENAFKSLRMREEIGDKNGIASSLSTIANVYSEQGKYSEALENAFKSLRIREELGDKSGIAKSLNNIAIMYNNQGKYSEALEYHFKSLRILEEIGDKRGVASSLNNIGSVYDYQDKYSEALEYHFKSLRIEEEIGNKLGIARSLNNIGIVYCKIGQFKQAQTYLVQSLQQKQALGMVGDIPGSLNSIAFSYCGQGKFDSALVFSRRSLALADSLGEKVSVRSALEVLSMISDSLGRHKESLMYYKRSVIVKDSLINLENLNKTSALKEGYEAEKREQQITLLSKEKALQESELERRNIDLARSKAEQALQQKSILLLNNEKALLGKEKDFRELTVSRQEAELSAAHARDEQNKQALALAASEQERQNSELRRRSLIQWSLAGFLLLSVIIAFWFRSLYQNKNAANAQILRQQEILENQTVEIELANASLHERNVLLEAFDREKNEFLGIATHDLKNPLTSISLSASMLQSFGSRYTVEKQHKHLQSILSDVDRMMAIITNLLDINTLERGGMQFTIVSFDIASVVEATVDHYRELAAAKNITLHFSNDAESSIAAADEQALMQVLDNLISNAVKYSPLGKNVFVRVRSHSREVIGHSSLAIGHSSSDNALMTNVLMTNAPMTNVPMTNVPMTNDYIRVEVQDEGQGISEDDMKKLFGKFARLTARPTGGEHSTGLGLSIVKKMVEAMNGRVWCESELGKGATFIVELPKADDNNL